MAWRWICISLESWMVSWYKNEIVRAGVSNCMRQCLNFLVLNVHIPAYLGSRGKLCWSPNWNEPHTAMGTPRFGLLTYPYPYRFGDPRHSKWGPHIGTGIPKPVWEPIWVSPAFKMGTPYRNGDPQIGMGRDMSIFQIGESP
jgi:hypothetical protein